MNSGAPSQPPGSLRWKRNIVSMFTLFKAKVGASMRLLRTQGNSKGIYIYIYIYIYQLIVQTFTNRVKGNKAAFNDGANSYDADICF